MCFLANSGCIPLIPSFTLYLNKEQVRCRGLCRYSGYCVIGVQWYAILRWFVYGSPEEMSLLSLVNDASIHFRHPAIVESAMTGVYYTPVSYRLIGSCNA